jgi:hypothetical protein
MAMLVLKVVYRSVLRKPLVSAKQSEGGWRLGVKQKAGPQEEKSSGR